MWVFLFWNLLLLYSIAVVPVIISRTLAEIYCPNTAGSQSLDLLSGGMVRRCNWSFTIRPDGSKQKLKSQFFELKRPSAEDKLTDSVLCPARQIITANALSDVCVLRAYVVS